jgi:hypothetical protein
MVSVLPPLPLNDGIVDGRMFGGDGTTLVLNGGVTVRSRSPHYGKPWNMGTTNATYRFASDPSIGRSLPRAPFGVRAEVSAFGPQTVTVVRDFATGGVRDLTALAGGR